MLVQHAALVGHICLYSEKVESISTSANMGNIMTITVKTYRSFVISNKYRVDGRHILWHRL